MPWRQGTDKVALWDEHPALFFVMLVCLQLSPECSQHAVIGCVGLGTG